MTARDLLEMLISISENWDLSSLQIVIRLVDSNEDTHMGGVAEIDIESGCTDTPVLVIDCDQNPANCPLTDEEAT